MEKVEIKQKICYVWECPKCLYQNISQAINSWAHCGICKEKSDLVLKNKIKIKLDI